jgi:hypothetical protein
MAGQWHEDITSLIKERHEAQTAGFRKAAAALLNEDEIRVPNVIPDVWKLSKSNIDASTATEWTLIVWEIELSNPLDERKLHRYARLWAEIDDTPDKYFNLYVVDRMGNEQEVDLSLFHLLGLRR